MVCPGRVGPQDEDGRPSDVTVPFGQLQQAQPTGIVNQNVSKRYMSTADAAVPTGIPSPESPATRAASEGP